MAFRSSARGGRGKDKGKDKNRDRTSTVQKRSRHLEGVTEIDFRDQNLLRKFVTQQGKIMPARVSGVSSKQQRQIARAIRRARVMGFML